MEQRLKFSFMQGKKDWILTSGHKTVDPDQPTGLPWIVTVVNQIMPQDEHVQA